MTTITRTHVNKAKKDLETLTHEVKRRLFEFETLSNLYEVQQGNISRYKTAQAFMRTISK